jgi:redox-sensing transcriptional repressor
MADRGNRGEIDQRSVEHGDPSESQEVSPLTLNRLSFYLRCLRQLQELGLARISSQELARRYHLSATQIRKDLAQFGEFGIRGVGYQVNELAEHLDALLGLDRRHPMVIVGMGNLGSALARFTGFNHGAFQVVAGIDNDPRKIGSRSAAGFTIRAAADLADVVRDSGALIGVLTVPDDVAQHYYDALADAGIRGVLNFATIRIKPRSGVPLKNVDLRINLEELAFFLKG